MFPTRVLIARTARALVPAAMVFLFTAPTVAAPPIGDDARAPFPPVEFVDGELPPVQITCPTPSAATALQTPPSLQVLWSRPDGGQPSPTMPFEYRYILLGPSSEFPVSLAVSDPESFRDYYAQHPLGPWTGWESTESHTAHAAFTNLIPGEAYLFAVIALDRAGNFSPAFDLSANLLQFVPGYPADPAAWSPVLTMSGPGFRFQYPHGSYCVCPSAEIPTQMVAHQRSAFRWSAEPGFICESLHVRWYRWALDIEDVTDETPRADEETDLRHWSQRSPEATSAFLGPFAPGEVHRLFVEVSDDIGLRSLGIVRIEVDPAPSPPEIELAVEARGGGLAEVSFSLPGPGRVEIGVFDVAGRRVATLERTAQSAGRQVVTWDGSNLGRGMYFCRLRAGSATATRAVLLRK